MTVMKPPFAFRDWVRKQSLPYSILAAKAPIDDVVTALQEIFQIQNHQSHQPLTGKLSNLQGVPVVKFKDFPWCVVYWHIGRATSLEADCRILSGKLSAQVLNLFERDASGWVEWGLYEEREDLEFAKWMRYDDSVYFKSSLRRRMNFEQLQPAEIRAALDRAIDELLSEQSLYIPGLDLDLADATIDRVDLLTLPDFPLGMKEFQNWMYQGHPEYSVFAVKAPIEQVGQTLVDRSKVKEWQTQIQADKTILDALPEDSSYSWIPMLQPANNQWTAVYWLLGGWESTEDICKQCSSSLQTRAISLEEEDTSCAVGYGIYDRGERIERADWCPGEEIMFESEVREEPEFDDFEEDEGEVFNQFIHETFIQEGVYLPPPDMKVSDSYLKRVDFVRRCF